MFDQLVVSTARLSRTNKPWTVMHGFSGSKGVTRERGGIIVFDLQDLSQLPGIAEPFFLLTMRE